MSEDFERSGQPQYDSEVPVLVFKAGNYPLHHGTAGIIRSLGRAGVPVYAMVEDRFTPAGASRYLAGKFVWKAAGISRECLFEGLAKIFARIGRRAILVPTDDFAAACIAENAFVLTKWFLFPPLPPGLPRRLANKRGLYSLCREHAIPCPEAAFPACLGDVHEFISRAAFPVVMKAAESQRTPAGMRSTSIARSAEELVALYERAGSAPVVLQEYIPETFAEDWIFHGYVNPRSGCAISFTGRKLRSYPPFAGPTSAGISVRNPVLKAQSEALLQSIGYAGIMDLDYRFDRRDGRYKLLDFNPRIGANFRMFENRAGIDVVRAMHLDLTGRPVPRAPAVEGRVFLVENYELLSIPGYLRAGGLTARGWLKSIQGNREFAWLALDDPAPFPAVCARLFLQACAKAIRALIPRRRPVAAKQPRMVKTAAAGAGSDREVER